MAIYGRGGDELVLLREATVEEVLKDWGIKPNSRKHDDKLEIQKAKDRVGYGMLWWAKYTADNAETLCELAYCRADNGFAEIDDTRRALMGAARYTEATGIKA